MPAAGYDAVVIGAGINGLVAAAELAGAGWRVALVEERERIGGFIDSGELTLPGFVHDTYSSWHPLFVTGPGYAALGADLHRHGLEYRNAETGPVTASVSERGVVVADRDPAATAARFAHAADADAYIALLERFEAKWAETVFGILGTEPSGTRLSGIGLGAVRRLGHRGLSDLVRLGVQSGRGLVRERFVGWEVDQLWTPWLLHAGLSPDHASGALMTVMMAFTMHAAGLPVVAGGQAEFLRAFTGLLSERGVETICGEPVTRIEVSAGRAVAVHTDARRLEVGRAVLACTATERLYRDLLGGGPRAWTAVARPGARATPDARDPATLALARRRPGRAAMQIHLALSAPVPWRDPRLSGVPLVHISDGAGSTGIACAQAEAGRLPAEPTVVVGQQCVLDPGRAPAGQTTLWLQLQELPWAPSGDAAGELDTTGGWSDGLTTAYVERVIARLEAYAPGLGSQVRASHVISPVALAAQNANAVEGDPYGGPGELDQSVLWRPGSGRGHATGVRGLFQIGAFTHPGPGLGGGSGHLVAQGLLEPSRRGRAVSTARRAVARLAPHVDPPRPPEKGPIP